MSKHFFQPSKNCLNISLYCRTYSQMIEISVIGRYISRALHKIRHYAQFFRSFTSNFIYWLGNQDTFVFGFVFFWLEQFFGQIESIKHKKLSFISLLLLVGRRCILYIYWKVHRMQEYLSKVKGVSCLKNMLLTPWMILEYKYFSLMHGDSEVNCS